MKLIVQIRDDKNKNGGFDLPILEPIFWFLRELFLAILIRCRCIVLNFFNFKREFYVVNGNAFILSFLTCYFGYTDATVEFSYEVYIKKIHHTSMHEYILRHRTDKLISILEWFSQHSIIVFWLIFLHVYINYLLNHII